MIFENKGMALIIALIFVVGVASVMFLTSDVPVIDISEPGRAESISLEYDETLTYVNANILEVVSGHAWQKHGTEASDAIKCLNNHGSSMAFKTFGFKDSFGRDALTNLWLCFDGTDWYAIVTTTLEKAGGNRIGKLITAYMVDQKKFMVIDDFVEAVKNKWNAVQINFRIEPGTVYLSPK